MNRSSLADKLKNINKCDICIEEYNRREKQPVIICSMHHTVCRECVKDLEATRKCPFCRETINFSKVVVNNYIFELLPSEQGQDNNLGQPPPNMRFQVPQQSPLNYPPAAANNYPTFTSNNNYPVQNINNPPLTSINYQPQRPVYPQNYFPPPPEQDIYYVPPQPSELDNIQDQPFLINDCCYSIQSRLRLGYQSERKWIYVCVFLLQLPYLIFDFYFSLSPGDPACMDTPYVNRAYVLRPWLLAIGITEASIMGILLIGASLRVCQIINLSCLKLFEFVSIGVFVLKIMLWMYMEIALYYAVIQPHCSGGIYAYGLVQFIIHAIFALLMCFFLSCCR